MIENNTFNPDKENHAPKYITVYDSLRSDIILNKYPEGSYLPPEFQLSKDYGVSRNTIRHAVQMLSDDGLVETIQGSGIKVLRANESKRNIDWSARRVSAEYLISGKLTVTPPAVDKLPASAEIAKIFNIAPGTAVYRLQYIWKLDGVPFNYQVQYLNRALMPGIHKYIDDGLKVISLAKEKWDLDCNLIEEHISCKSAGFIEANLLGVELGAAILYTTRFAACDKGGLEYAEFYHNPKYMSYFVKVI